MAADDDEAEFEEAEGDGDDMEGGDEESPEVLLREPSAKLTEDGKKTIRKNEAKRTGNCGIQETEQMN